MAKSFKATIDDFIAKSTQGALTVFKLAAQDVIADAQRDRFSGGNTPLDTSFLINSGQASINTLPIGASERPKEYAIQEWNSGDAVIVLNRVKPSDVLYFGWTANYARYMENKYKFMRLAAQQWPELVAKRAAEVKRVLNAK